MLKDILSSHFLNEGVLYYYFGNTAPFFILCTLLCVVAPYLLGSINFAVIISSKRYNDDVREHGSGNAGMTNMMRTYGRKAAALTLIGDALKAVVAALLGYYAFGLIGAYVAGFFCVLGHLYPIFFKFRGGKGVVTAAFSILMCNPIVFLVLVIMFVAIVLIWRYISLASIMCVLLYPLVLNGVDKLFAGGSGIYMVFAVLTTVLIVAKHKENIKRLLNKSESKFEFKKSVKSKDKKDRE
jgi:glycerol-3-phosphate acyltransferase PlsY